ncbi:MAG: AGE family epimerase/isomerase [Bacteriovoracaceae bacterium]|nr:AGE family epimerase/isomerase [Bacteroidota bacterium]
MKQLFFIAGFFQLLSSQTVFQSQYLQTPELTFGYVDSCAKFWMKAYDPVDGGFQVNINREGNLSGSAIKNTLNQSRDAYGFIRAFQMTGDTSYLRYARYALNFMYQHSWDKTYGGWFADLNDAGAATNAGASKSAYQQHYAMLGIAAAYEAMRDTTDWNWLMKGYAYNEAILWDADIANFGYYDYAAADGSNPADKSFNATVDAVTTHVLHLYLMTGDEEYKQRLLELADNMMYRIASTAASQQIGFAEKYNSTWQIKSNETMTIMGHVLKTAWCLARIYQIEKNPLYLSTAEMLIQNVLQKGYDHQNGGPYKDYNRVTGQMLMWGITDTAKAWWQMEQAITSGLMMYQLTGNEEYLTMADASLDFFMKYFVDHLYGDVFENANKHGGMIVQWGTTKGGTGKAAYHSIELGYYTYLYGKLLVKKEPVTLHYSFNAMPGLRQLRMRPVGVPEGTMKIAAVTRNGAAYGNYDSAGLMLTLPAQTDGIFSVTYAPVTPTVSVATTTLSPGSFALQQNYPNPFNPSTTIKFSLSPNLSHPHDGMNVVLKIYNVLGVEVATLVNEQKTSGTYSVQWNASQYASGTYFARLQSGSDVRMMKMLLVR